MTARLDPSRDAGADPRLSLALVFHNHQPVGNFGWVIAEVFEQAYRPLVELLSRHPSVRCALHYSGPLLEWIDRERPGFVDLLRALVERGQVELLGGGWFEPILVALPERDRAAQLGRMADELAVRFGRRPAGAWLAERVWEPDLPATLADAGYDWTIVDDAHLRAATIPDEDQWGSWTTDDQGRRLTLFASSQRLRYLIPFRDVDEVIEELRGHATPDGSRLGIMGDDGEKFGAWPSTLEHCWGEGRWVERFFEALEANAAWLTTTTPTDWTRQHAPIGRAYLPTGSYTEMTEWALPPDDAALFAAELHRAVDEGRAEGKFLRGGFWRNFQRRYREINAIHKQMLRTSRKVAALPETAAEKGAALDNLHRGQSNDVYWHGLFGGLYLAHLRSATLERLIAAEDAADAAAAAPGPVAPSSRLEDVDLDGIDEVLFESPGQVVTVKLDEGAGIDAWDIRPARHALAAVLRRRPEAAHARLREAERRRGQAPDGRVASIHDIVASREEGLAELLVYDRYERRSGLVHLLDPSVTPEAFIDGRFDQLGDFVDGAFDLVELDPARLVVRRVGTVRQGSASIPLAVTRTMMLGGGRLDPTLTLEIEVENLGRTPLDVRLGLEWSLTFLGGGHNPAASYEWEGGRSSHDARGRLDRVSWIRGGNTWIGVGMTSRPTPAADAWWAPIETISSSEAGFERSCQGSSLLFSWPLRLDPGGRTTVAVRHEIEASRDHAVEEGWTRAT
jgi:alpha-amylase